MIGVDFLKIELGLLKISAVILIIKVNLFAKLFFDLYLRTDHFLIQTQTFRPHFLRFFRQELFFSFFAHFY